MESVIKLHFINSQFYKNYQNIDCVIMYFKQIKNKYDSFKIKYNEFNELNKYNTNSNICNDILKRKIIIKHNIKKYVKYSNNIDDDFITSVNIGYIKNIITLIKNGANIHVNDDLALKVCSRCGHSEIVKIFC